MSRYTAPSIDFDAIFAAEQAMARGQKGDRGRSHKGKSWSKGADTNGRGKGRESRHERDEEHDY